MTVGDQPTGRPGVAFDRPRYPGQTLPNQLSPHPLVTVDAPVAPGFS